MSTHEILLVEDDALDARQLELALGRAEGARFSVRRASSAQEAEALLSENEPDLIALDLSLPDTSGAETFERIRAAAPGVPVVVMTGRADDALALQLLQAGAQDYLLKSTRSPTDLVRCFRYAIKRGEADRQLEAARLAAEETARARSSFVAAMSHEIRTPLNAILGLGDLLMDTPLRDDQRQYVETLRRAGRGLLDLLNNVLELSRLESDAFELARTPFDLRQLVEDTTEMFGFSAHRQGIHLLAEVSPEIPARVVGDPARLRQILVNLIGNAVKFTSEGGVEIGVEAGPENGLVIRVADSGPGIPPDRLEAIFGRYTQADVGVFGEHGGSGLGLALARDLCQRMQGTLHAENRPEGGALFQVVLPLPGEAAEGASPPTRCVEGLRVLVVEDDPVERHHYGRWLARAGAEVVEAASVDEACRLVEGQEFDAALLDSRMSGTGGIELADAWQRTGRGPARVVVALMTNHRASDVEHCEALGAHHLLKPLRPAAVVDAIAGVAPTHEPAASGSPETRDLDGLRVLLAEDNPDNRDLVEAFLRGTGVKLHAVGDGVEAVAARREHAFDLVLMDVSMPRMDGHEAVRQIRAWETETDSRPVPIVILTAHASEEARRASSEAGSDDHLVKPFDRAALRAAIARHGRCLAPASADAEVDPLIADLVPGYLERRRDDVAALEQALADGSFDAIRGLGHRMKGTGSGYGFPDITRLGAQLEEAGAAGDAAAIGTATRELSALLVDAAKCDAAAAQDAAGDAGRSVSR